MGAALTMDGLRTGVGDVGAVLAPHRAATTATTAANDAAARGRRGGSSGQRTNAFRTAIGLCKFAPASNVAAAMLRATAVLRASWLLVATLAAVWACSAARLLRRDASEPNFAELPAEDKMALLSREVVLMHHKRLQELNNTLTRLARLDGAERLHVTVVQTLGASEAAAADASAALLRALAPRLPFNLSHRPLVLPPSAADGTYSVDSSRYGTKRNSFRNLLHGLEGAFTAEPHGQTAGTAPAPPPLGGVGTLRRRDGPTEPPATASGARASRLQSRRSHRL